MGGLAGVVSKKDCVEDLFFALITIRISVLKEVGSVFMAREDLSGVFTISRILLLEANLRQKLMN